MTRPIVAKLSRFTVLLAFALFVLFGLSMLSLKIIKPLGDSRWYLDSKTKQADVIDFFQYYQAACLASSPDRQKVYDPEIQLKWTNELISPARLEKVFYNQQPPFSYPLLLPLALLPPNLAYVFWSLSQIAFGLAGIYLLGKTLSLSRKALIFTLASILASFPAYICIWHGNTSFWLLGFLTLYCLFLRNKRDIPAGIMLALASFKPQYTFIMLVPAIGLSRWPCLLAFLATELVLLFLAGMTIGFQNVWAYPDILARAESSPDFIGVNSHLMISLRGLFSQLISAKAAMKIAIALMFLALIPLFALWKKSVHFEHKPFERWIWAFTICLAVLLSPHAHIFDFLILSIAAVLTLPDMPTSKKTEPGCHLARRLWFSILFAFPGLSWMANYWIGHENSPLFFAMPCLFALTMLSGLIAYYYRQEEQSTIARSRE